MIEVAALASELMSCVIAAVREFGDRVLNKTQDDAAEATIGLGRRVLQKIFGTRQDGAPLPEPLADVAADPDDEDAMASLRLAIRKALAADSQLRADVEHLVTQAGVTVTALGERSIAAQTITGFATTGDNTTIKR